MTKKKYYDEYGNRVRSNPKKRFYKMFSFWFVLILSIVIIIIIVNLSTEKNVIVDEHIGSNNEGINNNVHKENEVNSNYSNNEQEPYNVNGNSDKNISDIDSKNDLLEGYDQLEVDFARIILMYGINISDIDYPTLHINNNLSHEHSTFATALGNFEFISDLDLTLLHFEYYDGETQEHVYVYYNPHGDGNITTYQLDDIELALDRKVNEMEQEVLNTAETIYVDTSEPYIVADFIDRVEFIYD